MSTALMLKNKEKSIKIEMPFNTQSLNNVESTLFLEEVKNYLCSYPKTKHIDICLHDINGHIRGKRIDISCLNKLADGCYFPLSVYAMSLDGKVIEDPSRVSVGYALNTIAHPLFTAMEREWYARDAHGNYILDHKGWRIKVVPSSLELDELMVAIWYFDDGSHNRATASQIVFNTQAFTVDECDMLREKLGEMGFKTSRSTNRGMPIISLLARSYLAFMEMVSPYLPHDCLSHKVDISNYNHNKNEKLGKKLTKEIAKEVIVLLNDGLADEQIAEMLCITKNSVRDVRLSRTWSGLTGGRKTLQTAYLSDQQVLEIRTLANSGISDDVIGEKYNRKPNYIQSIRLGTKRRLVGGSLTSRRRLKG